MEITFTAPELAAFQDKLGEWWSKRMQFVCTESLRNPPRTPTQADSLFTSLLREYDEKHPKPDWRTLL